jgi:tripartite-type tricarboxylate transporter receptor subunit TctC
VIFRGTRETLAALILRSVAQRRVSKDGGTFRTRVHPSRRAQERAPQDEVFIILRSLSLALSVSLLLIRSTWPCLAQTPAEFYKGRTIELDIGLSVGGAYDAYARMLARTMGKYVPGNPAIVPKTMEGAGSMRLANYLYNAAPSDGTTFGTINRGTPFEPLLGNKGAHFDAARYNWIGSTNNEVSVCVAWATSGVASFADVQMRPLIVGATGPSADTYQFPKIINAELGTQFKIVTGYPVGNDVDLAMERGEVQGRCGWSWTSVKGLHQAWLDQKKLNILFQMGLSKHRDLPDVPLIIDLAKTDEARAILRLIFARQVMAWPFLAPPGVPADRVEALRTAFMATMKDKDFLAEADKAGLEITPVAGADIQRLVQDIYATSASVGSKAADLLR